MGKLFLKLFRDIKQSLGQFISIMLVIAVGSFFFSGMMAASKTIDDKANNYYELTNFADGTGYFMLANDKLVEEIGKKETVSLAEGRYSFNTSATFPKLGTTDITFTSITKEINKLTLETADSVLPNPKKNATNEIECVVDINYAKAKSVEIGDTFTFSAPQIAKITCDMTGGKPIIKQSAPIDVEHTAKITGFFHGPEYIYKVNPQNASEKNSDFAIALFNNGDIRQFKDDAVLEIFNYDLSPNEPITTMRIYVDSANAPNALITTNFYNEIVIDVKNNVDINDVFDEYKPKTDISENMPLGDNADFTSINDEPFGVCLLSIAKEKHISYSSFEMTFDQIRNLIVVFPAIFFIVAVVITFISLSKTVENQRTQIGIMQAIGIEKYKIYISYICYALFASLIGSIVGGLIGLFALPAIYLKVFSTLYNLPNIASQLPITYFFISIIFSILVASLAALISSNRTLKEIPAKALRPKEAKKSKPIFFEKWKGLWRKLGFGAKMILRNIFLHKGRIILSSIGVIGCTMLILAGLGLKDRVNYIIKTYTDSANYDIMALTTETYPITKVNGEYWAPTDEVIKHDKTNNIKDVIFSSQNSVKVSYNEKIEDTTLTALPKDSNFINIYSDKKSKHLIPIKENSFILPHLIAEELGASVDDVVTLTVTINNKREQFEAKVTDISYQFTMSSIYTSYDILTKNDIQLLGNNVYIKLINTSQRSATLTKEALNEAGFSKALYTTSDMLSNITDMISILDTVVTIIVAGAAVLAITVIYNITSINVLERKREIATLMVLGYYRRETNRLIFVENIVITTIGCLLGLPLGYGLFYWIIGIVNSMSISLTTTLTPLVVIIGFALTFAFSIVATLLLNRKINKIDMVEALKGVE